MSGMCCIRRRPKDRKLQQMALRNPGRKFGMSGKLFWKQPLRGVVEKGVFKL